MQNTPDLESGVRLLPDGLYKLLNSTGRELAAKVDLTNKRIDDMNKRIDKMDERIEGLRRELVAKVEEARRLMEYLDVRLSEAEERARERDLRLARAFTGYQEFLMEFLVVRRVLSEEEAAIARREARRVMQIAVNPVTKEEWRRIGELLDKSELTVEEALELRDLARKVVEEHGDRYEAWKLHTYASIMVALAYKKEAEKRGKKVKEAKGELGEQR